MSKLDELADKAMRDLPGVWPGSPDTDSVKELLSTVRQLAPLVEEEYPAIQARVAELEEQVQSLTDENAGLTGQNAALTKERDEIQAKCASMEGHPDVIKAKQDARLKAARERLVQVQEEERRLSEELGEAVAAG